MDDLISRQKAINAIENTECELMLSEWEELVDSIKSVPSAQKKGEVMQMNYEVKLENKYLAFTFDFDNLGEALEFVRLALRYCSKEIKHFHASINRTVEDGEEYA